jgi:hypothetical protein
MTGFESGVNLQPPPAAKECAKAVGFREDEEKISNPLHRNGAG